uniref:Glyoxalase domain-containing protein 4 n=1 Tax=Caenorhabditis tropicalis TaxID=1561998 RepID=A0A1I7TT19_9PELO
MVLRHEEFDKGCEASCNGPYDERWSKTMIGYGSEDEHFVLELTYNYPIHSYDLGNDFRAIVIDSDSLFDKISQIDHRKSGCGRLAVKSPDGHEFKIGKAEQEPKVMRVQLNVGDLEKSRKYWTECLGMGVVEEKKTRVRMSFGEGQCELEIVQSAEKIDRKTGFGRIAFSYPGDKLQSLQDKVKSSSGKIINELLTLNTPGKADVQVVILADPDDHEICFVGDEGFRELSKVDPSAEKELMEQIKKDDSEKWY